jgi:hypothetical protein
MLGNEPAQGFVDVANIVWKTCLNSDTMQSFISGQWVHASIGMTRLSTQFLCLEFYSPGLAVLILPGSAVRLGFSFLSPSSAVFYQRVTSVPIN